MEELELIESAFDMSLVGEWGPWYPYRVTDEAVEAFARAIQADPAGGIPLLFAAMPSYAALQDLLPRWLHPSAFGAHRSMHGAYDLHLNGALVLGQELRSRGRVLGVREKPSMTVSFIELVTEDERQQELLVQYYSLVHPATTPAEDAGDEPPATVTAAMLDGDGRFAWDQVIGADLVQLYAEATGDQSAIHTDAAAAGQLGLPGTVIQGLCTLGVVSTRLLERVQDRGQRSARRLAARFTKTVFPGDQLTTVAAPLRPDAWAFETSRAPDDVVLGQAHLEIGSAA